MLVFKYISTDSHAWRLWATERSSKFMLWWFESTWSPAFFSCRKNNHAALLLIWVPAQSHFKKAAAADWMTSWLRTDPFTVTKLQLLLNYSAPTSSNLARLVLRAVSDRMNLRSPGHGMASSSHRANLTRGVEQSVIDRTWQHAASSSRHSDELEAAVELWVGSSSSQPHWTWAKPRDELEGIRLEQSS